MIKFPEIIERSPYLQWVSFSQWSNKQTLEATSMGCGCCSEEKNMITKEDFLEAIQEYKDMIEFLKSKMEKLND